MSQPADPRNDTGQQFFNKLLEEKEVSETSEKNMIWKLVSASKYPVFSELDQGTEQIPPWLLYFGGQARMPALPKVERTVFTIPNSRTDIPACPRLTGC